MNPRESMVTLEILVLRTRTMELILTKLEKAVGVTGLFRGVGLVTHGKMVRSSI